jgi:hypothetical protein
MRLHSPNSISEPISTFSSGRAPSSALSTGAPVAYASANTVTVRPAAPTVTQRSAARGGSNPATTNRSVPIANAPIPSGATDLDHPVLIVILALSISSSGLCRGARSSEGVLTAHWRRADTTHGEMSGGCHNAGLVN